MAHPKLHSPGKNSRDLPTTLFRDERETEQGVYRQPYRCTDNLTGVPYRCTLQVYRQPYRGVQTTLQVLTGLASGEERGWEILWVGWRGRGLWIRQGSEPLPTIDQEKGATLMYNQGEGATSVFDRSPHLIREKVPLQCLIREKEPLQ